MRSVILCFLLLVSGILAAQDTTRFAPSYNFDYGFGVYYQFNSFGSSFNNPAKLSPQLPPRRSNFPEVQRNWGLNGDLVTDNPFFHGAYYLEAGARLQPARGLTIIGSLTAEQRGFSDGQFSKRTRNFFPYLNARYERQIGKFRYSAQVGDFTDFTLYEGLTFYNLQTQSWVFKLQYGRFYLKHAGIGDLIRAIGLGIDDLYDYSVGLEDVTFGDAEEWGLTLRSGLSNNRGAFGGAFVNFSARVNRAEHYFTAVQYSRSSIGNAFLLTFGVPSISYGKLDLSGQISLRNYGADFNTGFSNTVFYRDPQGSSSFTNSTSEVFYPLNVYERPFNQWAVYTEYGARRVSGLNLQLKAYIPLFSITYLRVLFDLNTISSEGESFTYPFYSFGIGIRPTDDIDIFLERTNRVLNLDNNYPTLYAAAEPYFTIRAHKALSFRQEADRVHRGRFEADL